MQLPFIYTNYEIIKNAHGVEFDAYDNKHINIPDQSEVRDMRTEV